MNETIAPRRIDLAGLETLLGLLREDGRRVFGPTVRDGAIVYDEIGGVHDLPAGWTDRQEAGRYRLERRADGALFGHVVGPHAWKKYLFPPSQRLFSADRAATGFTIVPEAPASGPMAFLGVRACELAAIGIQDRVFLEGARSDTFYAANRARAFLIAVDCGVAGGACFCTSMGTGPGATAGFDLALTEFVAPGRHAFLFRAGTERGAALLARVPGTDATADDLAAADEIVRATARSMGRSLDTSDIAGLLSRTQDSPRWNEVASRCIACANCTMVCPTCFCSTVNDVTDLTADHTERRRHWDSCFNADFTMVHGGVVRDSIRARYRHWLTHKLANWHVQFGTSGCVGCGRCIVWCPAGIDLTEEIAALRASATPASSAS